MVRIIGIAFVILGLIAQPLIAAVPDFMPLSDTSSSMSMDHSDLDVSVSDHGTAGGDQAPCHENAAVQSASMLCTDCDSDCANGACASACSLSTLAVLNQSFLTFECPSAVRLVSASGALVQGLRARIFHPPKHA